jgi:hypothetical protein
VFQERWLALLAAAVLPGTGRDAAFRLHKGSGPGGFAIETGNGGEPVGHSALFDERLIEALHVVERLVRPRGAGPRDGGRRAAGARTGRGGSRRADAGAGWLSWLGREGSRLHGRTLLDAIL